MRAVVNKKVDPDGSDRNPKAVDPPLIATEEAINGGVNLFSRGITYISAEYDERTGEILRQLPLDRSGIQWGGAREPTPKQVEIIRTAKELWPNGCYPANRKDRRAKLKGRFKEKGLSPPGDTNIWQAFKFLEQI